MFVKFCLENGGSSLKVSRGEGGRVTRVCFRGKLNMLHCVCVCGCTFCICFDFYLYSYDSISHTGFKWRLLINVFCNILLRITAAGCDNDSTTTDHTSAGGLCTKTVGQYTECFHLTNNFFVSLILFFNCSFIHYGFSSFNVKSTTNHS